MGALGLNMAFVGRNIAANAPENSVGGWLLCIHSQLRPGVAAARSALVRTCSYCTEPAHASSSSWNRLRNVGLGLGLGLGLTAWPGSFVYGFVYSSGVGVCHLVALAHALAHALALALAHNLAAEDRNRICM
eukprot:COSAG02_NODE_1549_length_11966_cov_3.777282_8_plen_132_part_00